MPNDGDDKINNLTALWQTQPVNDIDLEAVKRNLRSERTKQRWYMVIDSLAFAPAVYMIVTYWDKLSLAAQIMNLVIFTAAIPLLMYQLWLRRVAAFSKDSQTVDHLLQLSKQIKNNVKIAFITKHSAWSAVVFIAAFLLERYLSAEVAPEKLLKMFYLMGGLCVVMVIWYVWADKRQKRFEKQLKALEDMASHRYR
jgi:Flp pilus assembly protein TadB